LTKSFEGTIQLERDGNTKCRNSNSQIATNGSILPGSPFTNRDRNTRVSKGVSIIIQHARPCLLRAPLNSATCLVLVLACLETTSSGKLVQLGPILLPSNTSRLILHRTAKTTCSSSCMCGQRCSISSLGSRLRRTVPPGPHSAVVPLQTLSQLSVPSLTPPVVHAQLRSLRGTLKTRGACTASTIYPFHCICSHGCNI